jgi:hypothetical protein
MVSTNQTSQSQQRSLVSYKYKVPHRWSSLELSCTTMSSDEIPNTTSLMEKVHGFDIMCTRWISYGSVSHEVHLIIPEGGTNRTHLGVVGERFTSLLLVERRLWEHEIMVCVAQRGDEDDLQRSVLGEDVVQLRQHWLVHANKEISEKDRVASTLTESVVPLNRKMSSKLTIAPSNSTKPSWNIECIVSMNGPTWESKSAGS